MGQVSRKEALICVISTSEMGKNTAIIVHYTLFGQEESNRLIHVNGPKRSPFAFPTSLYMDYGISNPIHRWVEA